MPTTMEKPTKSDGPGFLLRASRADEVLCIPFTPGQTVREILDGTDWRVRSACGGIGACGQCLVRIQAGTGIEPSKTERAALSFEQIRQGVRLACQFKPTGDSRIIIENPAPISYLKMLPPDTDIRASAESAGPIWLPSRPYGVAVDLGTTQIRLSCFDILKSRWISGRTELNPQAAFGADVLTRLEKALESRDCARQMSMLASDAIAGALQDMAAKESCDLEKIGRLAVVGNTPMLALLSNKNQGLLLQPEYWTRGVDCVPADPNHLSSSWGLGAEARIEIVRPLAGFIGSDLLAGLLATELIQGPAGSLLMDFGTNSEIALWDGVHLWATSAAGGPAFEGCGITCGMPAQEGAVYRAELDASSSQFDFQVFGGGQAKGLCGSGLLDAIAGLVRIGALKTNGRFQNGGCGQGCTIGRWTPAIRLQNRDIDAFQRAKAAIGAGTMCLLKLAGMRPADLRRICVCGAFGHFLHIANAQAIGLLPEICADRVELFGNAAQTGCEILLFSPEKGEILDDYRNRTRIINMAALPEFENRFVQNLYLRPMHLEGEMRSRGIFQERGGDDAGANHQEL